ncbi:lytic transglycosylase domain-containing protein [Nocardioides panacis]|uniref:Lytic transglycosylase domain-containing protein n=1 Tax=Nocardioides panacis TaxID=2849501 RepID=A0A975Y0F6_9ACTN|nr:lytic transglycosylase domain-containing protein [Nocardioides panacis]QWZ08422.1 lytic transglycosylase domain-containing protein [Nocardioides panacis]
MPRGVEYVPKHRGPHGEPALKKGIRKSVIFSGVAVVATGMAVSSGIAVKSQGSGDSASASLASASVGTAHDSTRTSATSPSTEELAGRTLSASRSDRRTSVDAVKKAVLNQQSGGQVTETEDLTSQDPRTIARAMLPDFGFGSDQFSCLDSLYMGESGWNVHADNPSSSAYGIPQALPGSKMSSAGSDWEDNAATQIRWGLGYIQGRYGSPCGAWSFKQGNGWY